MNIADIVVTEAAIQKAKRLGIDGDVAVRVARMAKGAAHLTHPLGNRRYDEFVLRVDNKVVMSIDVL